MMSGEGFCAAFFLSRWAFLMCLWLVHTEVIKAFKQIFLLPSSVDKFQDSKSTCSGNARIHDMKSVKVPSIAYIATQVWFQILPGELQFDIFPRFDLLYARHQYSRAQTLTWIPSVSTMAFWRPWRIPARVMKSLRCLHGGISNFLPLHIIPLDRLTHHQADISELFNLRATPVPELGIIEDEGATSYQRRKKACQGSCASLIRSLCI